MKETYDRLTPWKEMHICAPFREMSSKYLPQCATPQRALFHVRAGPSFKMPAQHANAQRNQDKQVSHNKKPLSQDVHPPISKCWQ